MYRLLWRASAAKVALEVDDATCLRVQLPGQDAADWTERLAFLVHLAFTDAGLQRAGDLAYDSDLDDRAQIWLDGPVPAAAVLHRGRTLELAPDQVLLAIACGLHVFLLTAAFPKEPS